jgi:Protein of unknown function (DUF3142)
MTAALSRFSKLAAMASLVVVCLSLRSDKVPRNGAEPSMRMNRLPHQTLWAWERPEDLHTIDPMSTAIAYLDQTVMLGVGDVSKTRRQPLSYPSTVVRIAVVRIEALPGANLDEAQERQTVDLLLRSAIKPGIAALQIDFDATRSQRAFYGGVLRDLRRQMPTNLPLSITALASWCSYDDWIAGLPVDEAVPMFFRMEPDRRRARPDSAQFRVREPLCMGSIGISTRDEWPGEMDGKRVYVFADRGWRDDLPLVAERKLP